MSDFLVRLFSGIASQLFQAFTGWYRQRQLEEQAASARALEQQVESLKAGRDMEDRLRDKARQEVAFSYDAWKEQP